MVQRKVSNKIGIYADHVKSEKLLVNLKPSSFPHQDGKNRGADLKKKMKKSRSFRLSDYESLRSPSHRREVPQPGKPPAPDVPATAKKKSPAKTPDASPNYMKSTSSSAAKKEHPQVSPLASQISSDESPSRRNSTNSKLSAASVHKPTKTLARTSSLKLGRTLTKSPSFKPVRASTRKCSPVVLCDVQRETCSSTLKDSKFPGYLQLNPGGTESEGTSAMKVCPYNYCSLNGHHHPPLPPLKRFLWARRVMLKTQKSIKLGCLSPRRPRSPRNNMKYTGDELGLLDAKSPTQELELHNSAINPMIQEEHTDFFIEIYTVADENNVAAITTNEYKGDHDKTDPGATDIKFPVEDPDETAAEDIDVDEVESLSDAPTCSEIDFEGNLNLDDGVISTEMVNIGCFPEEDGQAEIKEIGPQNLDEEETMTKCFGNQDDIMVERSPSIQQGELDSEVSDTEWEAGIFSATYIDDEVNYSTEAGSKSDMERRLLEVDNNASNDEPGCHFEQIMADQVLQEPINLDEENVNSEIWFFDMYSELDGSHRNLDSDEFFPVSKEQSYHQVCPVSDALAESVTEECDGVSESGSISMNPCFPAEEPSEDPRAVNKDEIRVFEAYDESVLPMPEDKKTDQSCPEKEIPTAHAGADAVSLVQTHDHSSDVQSQTNVDNPNEEEGENLRTIYNGISNSINPLDQTLCELPRFTTPESRDHGIHGKEVDPATKSDAKETCTTTKDGSWIESKNAFLRAKIISNQELSKTSKSPRWKIGSKRAIEEWEEQREFNPREPNYLLLEPDPEAEKVDLKHQMVDERKNAEEWMVDYALRQTVDKLAPARKRKVALLVEAFETVMPVSKWETRLQHTSSEFTHTRPIQTCS